MSACGKIIGIPSLKEMALSHANIWDFDDKNDKSLKKMLQAIAPALKTMRELTLTVKHKKGVDFDDRVKKTYILLNSGERVCIKFRMQLLSANRVQREETLFINNSFELCIPWGLREITWLFEARQAYASGKLIESDRDKAFALVQEHKARPASITFNSQRKLPNIKGGNCSAYVLDLMLQLGSEAYSSLPFDWRLVYAGQHLGQQSWKYVLKMRSIQGALNCIERNEDGTTSNFEKDKIQALANYGDFRVIKSSPVITLRKSYRDKDEFLQQVAKAVDDLGTGSFWLRTIELPKTLSGLSRDEEAGHSMLYFSKKCGRFLYDPNVGCLKLTDNYVGEIAGVLQDCMDSFDTSRARFHQLKKRSLSSGGGKGQLLSS